MSIVLRSELSVPIAFSAGCCGITAVPQPDRPPPKHYQAGLSGGLNFFGLWLGTA